MAPIFHQAGTSLGPAPARSIDAQCAAGDLRSTHPLREFSCLECATLLELEIIRKDEEPLWSMLLA